MKTIEEQAAEFSKFEATTGVGSDLLSYRQGLYEGYIYGYKAAKDEYEAKIQKLETQLENWQYTAVHGDEGL